MRCKTKQAAPLNRIILAMQIDAGMVPPVMQNTPHVRADPAEIEDIIQALVDRRARGDCVMVAVMGDIQQKKRLREAA